MSDISTVTEDGEEDTLKRRPTSPFWKEISEEAGRAVSSTGEEGLGLSRLIHASDLRGREEPPWLAHRAIAPVGVGQLWGATYTGKTYVALDLAMRIANGMPDWFGHEITPPDGKPAGTGRPVIYVLMEGSWGFGRRLQAWLDAHNGMTDDNLYVLDEREVDLNDQESLKQLALDIYHAVPWGGRPKSGRPSPGMVIIDTQSLALPGLDENANFEMSRVFRDLKDFARELDTFVMTVHHAGYTDGNKKAKHSRGASSQGASIDLSVQVHKPDPQSPTAFLQLGKVKGMMPSEWMTFAFHRNDKLEESWIEPRPELHSQDKDGQDDAIQDYTVCALVRNEPGINKSALLRQMRGSESKNRDRVNRLVNETRLVVREGDHNALKLYLPEHAPHTDPETDTKGTSK